MSVVLSCRWLDLSVVAVLAVHFVQPLSSAQELTICLCALSGPHQGAQAGRCSLHTLLSPMPPAGGRTQGALAVQAAYAGTRVPQLSNKGRPSALAALPKCRGMRAKPSLRHRTAATASAAADPPLPPVVNWHLEARCNYACKFCFATFEDVKEELRGRRQALQGAGCAGTSSDAASSAGGPPTDEQLLAVPRLLAEQGVSRLSFVGELPGTALLDDLPSPAHLPALTCMIPERCQLAPPRLPPAAAQAASRCCSRSSMS